jgi:hypothetical protein
MDARFVDPADALRGRGGHEIGSTITRANRNDEIGLLRAHVAASDPGEPRLDQHP